MCHAVKVVPFSAGEALIAPGGARHGGGGSEGDWDRDGEENREEKDLPEEGGEERGRHKGFEQGVGDHQYYAILLVICGLC